MKHFANALIALLITTLGLAQTVTSDGLAVVSALNLESRSAFCLMVMTTPFDRELTEQLEAALMRQASLYYFPAHECIQGEDGSVFVSLLIVDPAISVTTRVYPFGGGRIQSDFQSDYFSPIIWEAHGLTVGGEGSVTDRAWPLVQAQFEQLVLAWRRQNPWMNP